MRSSDAAEAGMVYPSVFVVDSQAGYPLPGRPYPRRGGPVQWPLYLLMSLALCGMAVEACFIYHLYTTTRPPSDVGQMAKISQDRAETESLPARQINPAMKPSKPTAHLTVGRIRPRADGIMLWNTEGGAITHELDYKDGGLQVQKEGFYFVYSKLYFVEPRCAMFTHSVLRRTSRYLGADLQLMESRRYHCTGSARELLSSYLGGVYHLFKGDTILVKAENQTLVALRGSYDNFFGAYMI
ncbi:tumor necrosis factor ligand superfamily member 14 [Anguilla rostrata]|uniref:tumor necrosis factor ligand superfamily member 14 n=1 Tax=Anguilla rostrata TaxID=7938 RepID=UPI0030CE7A09